MQVMPNDDIDLEEVLEVLLSAGLIETAYAKDGRKILLIRNFLQHQKISNPTKSKISTEISRKLSIPLAARRALALTYGCQPGDSHPAACYYCGAPGLINWQRLSSGRPGSWVHFMHLEIDHLHSEHSGGETLASNFVLACMDCNRSKGTKTLFEFSIRNNEGSLNATGALLS